MSHGTDLGSVDLVVVGAGIVGLGAALAARQRGLRVAVVERNARCVGASIRNFGLVTVTGQPAGAHWQRARRSRDIWLQVAAQAGIGVLQQGLHVLARRPQAAAVLEAFTHTAMGEGCRLLTAAEAARSLPVLQPGAAVLHSPHELRVESREAIPRLAQWLAESQGVRFLWGTPVHAIDLPRVHTSRGVLQARLCVVCPGHDLHTLYPAHTAPAAIRVCTLQMLRLRPAPALPLAAPLLSDLSLVRYAGFADLPEAADLRRVLQAEQGQALARGVHLIVVQSADGSLVVGDSHVDDDTEQPFAQAAVDGLILDELRRAVRLDGEPAVVERWSGSYATAAGPVFQASPAPGVALGIVTGGTGASTGFAFGEELVESALATAR